MNFPFLFKFSFRNLLRHRARAIFTFIAVSMGAMFIFANFTLIEGSHYYMLEYSLKAIFKGNFNVYHRKFKDEPALYNSFEFDKRLKEKLEKEKSVESYFAKVETGGLLSYRDETIGVIILGVNLDELFGEKSFFKLIKEGNNEGIYISKTLSERLNIKINDSLLILTQDYYGSISADLFKIKGIFVSKNPEFDKRGVIFDLKDLQNFLTLGNKITELSIFTKNLDISERIKKRLENILPENTVILSWKEDMPGLKNALELDSGSAWVIIYTFLVLILLIIFATFYMNITERTRENGVILAIGSKPSFLFKSIILEALILSLFAAAFGSLLGFLLSFILYVKPITIKFEAYSSILGTEEFYIKTRYLFSHFVYTYILTIIMCIIGAFFPARRIRKIKPQEALRHV